MEQTIAQIIGLIVYKLACLAVGALFGILGYKLFKAGIWGQAGDIEAVFQNNKLLFKNGTPGGFFALVGAGIIIYTILKGITMPSVDTKVEVKHIEKD